MVKRHQGLKLTQEQRLRWITRMAATADLVGLPDDPDFRAAFVGYLEWSWGEAPPFVPFPWDDPEAADRGRARYAAGTDPTPGGPD